MNVRIYLKGWRNGALYADAANDPTHPLHDAAMVEHGRSFSPYKPGDTVYLAVEYLDDGDDRTVCDRAFELFNVGDPHEDSAVARYRHAGHRSLSVGDVVVVEDRAYTCDRVGWASVDFYDPQTGDYFPK